MTVDGRQGSVLEIDPCGVTEGLSTKLSEASGISVSDSSAMLDKIFELKVVAFRKRVRSGFSARERVTFRCALYSGGIFTGLPPAP